MKFGGINLKKNKKKLKISKILVNKIKGVKLTINFLEKGENF